MSQHEFISLLDSIEIDPLFIENDLADLLENLASVGIAGLPTLLSTAVTRFETHVDEIRELSEKEIEKKHRGESLGKHKIVMPHHWQLSQLTREYLLDLFRIDAELLTREVLEFKRYIRTGPIDKQRQSWHWGRSFVEYFAKSFSSMKKQSAVDTAETMPDDSDVKSADQNKKLIEKTVAHLRYKFSLNSLTPISKRWSPTKGAEKYLVRNGFTRAAIYDQRNIGPFINKCNKEKIPYSKTDGEYIRYIKIQRERLQNAVAQLK